MDFPAGIRNPAPGKLIEHLQVRGFIRLTVALPMFLVISASANAQQVTGTLGQAEATTTINGKQIPEPPPKFGGVIKESAKDSTPWWPPRVVPPKGAPNILLIMTDDQGYGVSGTFGGVIPTPNLDRIAKAGLRYIQFHSTSLCSPTRAALITGRNHHSVGYGVIGELSTGYPGYDSIIGLDNASIAEILKENGYATSWFGKDHNVPGFQYSSEAGPFEQWPSGMGFQYFYGFLGGETDQWEPYLFRDHTQVYPWVGHPGYNLTTDMADDAIRYMHGLNAAAPDKPFFVYYVPGGSHSPHQPTQEWIDKFKGKFDMGWNAMRDQIFANQKRLGVIPANTQLTPWPDDLPKWDSLSAVEKKMYARQAEVFAAYTAYTDYEIGRVIQEVQDEGKLDNTLIIYIDGDNGTSPEGSLYGTYNQYTAYNGILSDPAVKAVKAMNYCTMMIGARTKPIRIWRCRGRGHLILPSSGPSRWRRISAGPGRAWPFRGPAISKTSVGFAPSSTMSSTLFRPSSKPLVSRRPRWSTGLSRNRSKA